MAQYKFKVCSTRITEVTVNADNEVDAKQNVLGYNEIVADDFKSEEIDDLELMNVEE